MEYVTLSNGVKMLILGYGVYQVTKDECERCVLDALEVGYRSIDTAQSYFNEEEVGSAMKKSGIPREEIFLTSKVWVEHYGYENPWKNPCGSSRQTIWIYCCSISRSTIITALTARWRICTTKGSCVPSVFPTFIRTVWWTSPPLPASRR